MINGSFLLQVVFAIAICHPFHSVAANSLNIKSSSFATSPINTDLRIRYWFTDTKAKLKSKENNVAVATSTRRKVVNSIAEGYQDMYFNVWYYVGSIDCPDKLADTISTDNLSACTVGNTAAYPEISSHKTVFNSACDMTQFVGYSSMDCSGHPAAVGEATAYDISPYYFPNGDFAECQNVDWWALPMSIKQTCSSKPAGIDQIVSQTYYSGKYYDATLQYLDSSPTPSSGDADQICEGFEMFNVYYASGCHSVAPDYSYKVTSSTVDDRVVYFLSNWQSSNCTGTSPSPESPNYQLGYENECDADIDDYWNSPLGEKKLNVSSFFTFDTKPEPKCLWDTDCLATQCEAGAYCQAHPFWSQCREDPSLLQGIVGPVVDASLFSLKNTLGAACIGTRNGPHTGAAKWGCEVDSDCCNSAATCSVDKHCLLPCLQSEEGSFGIAETEREARDDPNKSKAYAVVIGIIATIVSLMAIGVMAYWCSMKITNAATTATKSQDLGLEGEGEAGAGIEIIVDSEIN